MIGTGRIPKDPVVRFWAKVDRSAESGCWLWLACQNGEGYGYFAGRNCKMILAHRFSWELENGTIPDGLVIDHLCRNSICVNPSHMEVVTVRENTRRGKLGWMLNVDSNFCANGHEFTEDNLYRSKGKRACKRCILEHCRVYSIRRKEGGLSV